MLCLYFSSLQMKSWQIFDFYCIFRSTLERGQTDCVCDFSDRVEVFPLRGWVAGRASLVWIRSTPGVSLLWGLCEALWAGLLVSGCILPIGCFCLTKTQWGSGLLKDAVSLFVLTLRKIICFVVITSYSIDETLLFWWDHLTLMGQFCVINIWMESECQCYSLIHSTGTTLKC